MLNTKVHMAHNQSCGDQRRGWGASNLQPYHRMLLMYDMMRYPTKLRFSSSSSRFLYQASSPNSWKRVPWSCYHCLTARDSDKLIRSYLILQSLRFVESPTIGLLSWFIPSVPTFSCGSLSCLRNFHPHWWYVYHHSRVQPTPEHTSASRSDFLENWYAETLVSSSCSSCPYVSS